MLDITEVLTGAVVIGVVGSMRRGTLKAVTAEVRSRPSASSAETRTREEEVMRKPVTGEARASDAECASGVKSPKAASRVTGPGVAFWGCWHRLSCGGSIVNMKGVTDNDGDERTGDGRSRIRMRRRKDGPDRRGGEAHVAEWHRVGAKRVLGDVGRGEGSGTAKGEGTAGIVVKVSVVVEMKGVFGNGDDGAMPRRDEARKRGQAQGESALSERGRANE